MVRFLQFTLLSLLFLLSLVQDVEAISCNNSFSPRTLAVKNHNPLYRRPLIQITDLKKQGREILEDRFLELIRANAEKPYGFYSDQPIQKIQSITKIHDHSNYPVYEAQVLFADGEQRKVGFRTNGHATFLHNSFVQIRSMEKPQVYASLVDDFGFTHSVEQTMLIASELPTTVRLSRIMLAKEWSLWLDGRWGDFHSRYNRNNRKFYSPAYENPVHFALNSYDFFPPQGMTYYKVYVEIPKKILVSLIEQGSTFINTYSPIGASPRFGMGAQAQTNFGLEVEVVIDSAIGLETIAPFMKLGTVDPFWTNNPQQRPRGAIREGGISGK